MSIAASGFTGASELKGTSLCLTSSYDCGDHTSRVPAAILTPARCPPFTLKAVLVWVMNYVVVPFTTNLKDGLKV